MELRLITFSEGIIMLNKTHYGFHFHLKNSDISDFTLLFSLFAVQNSQLLRYSQQSPNSLSEEFFSTASLSCISHQLLSVTSLSRFTQQLISAVSLNSFSQLLFSATSMLWFSQQNFSTAFLIAFSLLQLLLVSLSNFSQHSSSPQQTFLNSFFQLSSFSQILYDHL